MPKKMTTSKAPKGPAKAPKNEASETANRPPWPRLHPLAPTGDLALDVLLDDQIILIHRLFTTALSRQYTAFLSSLPLTTTPGQPKKGEALRVNDRYQIDDPHFAEQLWSTTALKDLVTAATHDWGGEVIGLNPNIRIYRSDHPLGRLVVERGLMPSLGTPRANSSTNIVSRWMGVFDWNEEDADDLDDDFNNVTIPTSPPTPARTTWTLLIYLTGPETGCTGGETAFYPEHGQIKAGARGTRPSDASISVAPEVGMALLHKHGNDCLLHEGKEVLEGVKWIIRSDLCVKR